MSTKVRKRWEELPRDVHQTITPLLGAVYSLELTKTERYVTTIYPQMKTYREWLQAWTVELIRRVMEVKAVDGLTDAQGIFGVFDTNPKNMDMAVAHHLLPHLVLHLLLTETTGEQIKLEIEEVLRDQLKPNLDNAPDKRMLSAQVVFQLMDHLSKWLRKSRLDNGRQSSSRPVEELLSSIDTSLVANAAMKSGAFARSLRNFEERIVFLRTKENRSDADLQTHFESLHEIYAELDEPDGMEGVSAFVVSPSLDLQIREHESTGRWTAAQSCWEVHLQHDPENVKFQVGLLRSLQNLGHYGELCARKSN
jgi:serine/threonine-protein kinase ATR